MELRFHKDPDTGQPHIYSHEVSEEEVHEAITYSGEDRPSFNGSRIAIGQTVVGRYLRVIYVPDPGGDSAFVVTAYEFAGKTTEGISPQTAKEREMNDQQFPPGWDEERVKRLLAHYEQMDDDAMIAEDEDAEEIEGQTLMVVPTDLVPAVRGLIAQKTNQ